MGRTKCEAKRPILIKDGRHSDLKCVARVRRCWHVCEHNEGRLRKREAGEVETQSEIDTNRHVDRPNIKSDSPTKKNTVYDTLLSSLSKTSCLLQLRGASDAAIIIKQLQSHDRPGLISMQLDLSSRQRPIPASEPDPRVHRIIHHSL
jgi:hypothetical protein